MEFLTTLFVGIGVLVSFIAVVLFLGWLLSFITPRDPRWGPR